MGARVGERETTDNDRADIEAANAIHRYSYSPTERFPGATAMFEQEFLVNQ